jgi:hypothetical protein
MSILAIFTGNNVTKQMYEALRKEVNWEQDHPAGVILHMLLVLMIQAIICLFEIQF